MSADWSQVTLWNSTRLGTAADELLTVEKQLVEMGQDTFGQSLGEWEGTAAMLANVQFGLLRESLEDQVVEVAAARRAIQDAAGQVAGVERVVRRAQDMAAENDLWIAADGTVNDYTAGGSSDDPVVQDVLDSRDGVVSECQALVDEAVRRASSVDADLFGVLSDDILGEKLARQDFSGFKDAEHAGRRAGDISGFYAPPQDGATPEQNKAWWAALTNAERKAVRTEHPEWLADRDGLSARLRDEANRKLLKRYTKQYQREYAELQEKVDTMTADRSEVERHLWLKNDVLPALDELGKLAETDDHQILGLTIEEGRRTQAVVAVGDVDTAVNVAVFTPGFSTTAAKLAGKDQDMLDLRYRAEKLAQYSDHDDSSVAVVSWLDYQAPQVSTIISSDNSVASTSTALRAGEDLADFYEGINTSRSTDPHLVALGHSYGSAVTGAALTERTGVDDAVVFGSPGIPLDSDLDVEDNELHVDGHVYNEQADGDWVGSLRALGTDPSLLPGVVELDTQAAVGDDGTPLSASQGHSQYFKEQSTSQYNLSAVIIDEPELAIRQK